MPKTDPSSNTRLRLLETTIDLLAAGDLSAINFVSVAARANLSRGAMHHYFTNREHLFGEVIDLIDVRMREAFRLRLEQLPASVNRMVAMVDIIWELLGSRECRAYDRLRNALGSQWLDNSTPGHQGLSVKLRQVTDGWVQDAAAQRTEHGPQNSALPHLALSALLGAASMSYTIGPPAADPEYRHLRQIIQQLVALAEISLPGHD